MKRNLKKTILVVLAAVVLVFALALSGCGSEKVSVTSIALSSTDGTQSVYTVTYSDGSTSDLTVKNGNDVTAEELYSYYKSVYGDDLTYADFLKIYLTVPSDNSSVIGESLQSAVKVYTEFVETSIVVRPGIGGISTSSQTAVYIGSGVIYEIDEDYVYMITNYHVIYDSKASGESKIAQKITCYLYGSEGAPVPDGKDESGNEVYDYGAYAVNCEYVGGSITSDIAIIRAARSDMEAVNPNIRAAEFAEKYYVGETAIAIGNPEGEGISVTEGIVSVDNEYINLQIDSTTRSYRSLRIDTSIYGGSSGGGLYNKEGKLIGITNAGDTTDENINYAVPLEIAKGMADNILYYFKDGNSSTEGAYKVTLGVTVVSQNAKYVYDQTAGYGTISEEIVVSEVSSGSIAKEVGLEVNDRLDSVRIVTQTGEERTVTLDRNFDISDVILTLRPGDTITFGIERANEKTQSGNYTIRTSDLEKLD